MADAEPGRGPPRPGRQHVGHQQGKRPGQDEYPQQYLGEVGARRLPVGGEEILNDDERRLERLLLGLRMAEGVPEEWVGGAARADDFVARGLAARRAGRLALTARGMLLANELILELAG